MSSIEVKNVYKLFGPEAGHVRLVYGVQSLPIDAPVIVETIFEIEPKR